MQKQSRIKSVQPRLENGQHHTYQMIGKTFYEYIVEMENGDKGRAAGTQDVFRFKEGEMVLYEPVSDPKHGDRLKSFAAVEGAPTQQSTVPTGQATGQSQQQQRYKEDPDKSRKIIAQSSLSNAIEWMLGQPADPPGTPDKEKKRTSKVVLQVAAFFEQWVHDSINRHGGNQA